MKYIWLLALFIVFTTGCGSIKYQKLYSQSDELKREKLKDTLLTISNNRREANELATLAIIHSKRLANSYNLVSPPSYHNFLVNSGERKKGLCYHFVDDLMREINKRDFKSFKFRWGRANAEKLNEHNVIVVLGNRENQWEEGVVLDAWRDSGRLFFTKVKDDKEYRFRPWQEGDIRISR